MNNIPPRRKRPRMLHKDETVIRCASHLQFVRGHVCAIEGKNGHECEGKIQACHYRTGTNGGMGMKPGDNKTWPGCAAAHALQHQVGEAIFQVRFGIQLEPICDALWDKSPAGKRYRSTLTGDQ